MERELASTQYPGALAHLGYASRSSSMLANVTSSGLATVVFPRFAQQALSRRTGELAASFGQAVRLLLLVSVPVTLFVALFSHDLVALLFERRAFTAGDTRHVGDLFAIFSLNIIAVGVGSLTARVLYALGKYRLLTLVGVAELLAYVGYAYALTRWLGLVGVALAQVVYFGASALWQLLLLQGRLGCLLTLENAAYVCRVTAGSLAAGLAGWLVAKGIGGLFLRCAVGGGLCVLLLPVMFRLLKIVEFEVLWTLLRNRAARALRL